MAHYDINIQDYWWILRKRRFMIISAVVLFGLFSYLAGLVRAPDLLYESTSAVKVERATDYTTMLLSTVAWSTWDNVATQSVIITSFPIMEKVSRRMGWIPDTVTTDEVQHTEQYSKIVADLRLQLTVMQEANTNIINITATAKEPREAQEIANAVAKAYQESNTEERNKKIRETKQFIENQMKLQEQRLRESENQLKKFKETSNLLSVESQTQSMLSHLAALEASVDQLNTHRADIQGQMDQFQRNEVSLKSSIEPDNSTKNVSFLGALNNRIMELKMRREILLNDYTEGHPEIKGVESELKTIITTVSKELKASLNEMDSRHKAMQKQIAEVRAKIAAIPEQAGNIERLQREVETNGKLNEELKTKYQEVLIQESGKIQEVSIVKPGLESKVPTNAPRLFFNAALGSVIGLIMGILLALVRESLDTSISTVEEIEGFLKVPVLGVIPGTGDFTDRKKENREHDHRSLVVYHAPNSPVAEAYRSLRSHFQFSRRETKTKVVLITSSSEGEGKSYNAVNLALSLAQTGDRVLLIDADLRKPVLHRIFGIDREPGLTDYLWGNCALKEGIKTIIDVMAGKFEMGDLLKTPGLDYLHILTAGSSLLNPWGVLRSPRLKEMIREVEGSYDTIIIDSAPILAAADTSDIASEVDGVILIYEVGRISRGLLNRCKEQLENAHSKVLGVILNNMRPEVAPMAYQYYANYHAYTEDASAEAGPLTRWGKLKQWIGQKLPKPVLERVRTMGGFFIFLNILVVALLSIGLLWQTSAFIRDTYLSVLKLFFPG